MMNRRRIAAVVRKDLRELKSTKMALLPVILVPVILCIVLPCVLVIVFLKVDTSVLNGIEMLEKLFSFYVIPLTFSDLPSKLLYVFFNYSFMPFFMIIPLMLSSVIAANAVVGEKERKTLETLLYTPITNRELLAAKLLSSFLPAVVISIISFAGFFLFTNLVFGLFRGMLLVRAWIWLPGILLVSPSVSALGLSLTLLVSIKAKTYMEAQQTSGIIVLPFVALIYAQIAGAVVLKPWYLPVFALALFVVSYIIISRIGPKFSREKIIGTL
ncbi:MAG: ABC transporter permease [Spirochaetales bacterium]|nr:MAG: ABC transporter permease [Spirochaetales bacterium]